MSMTREEAIEMVELGASILACYAEDHLRDKLLEALTILAPEPRKEPPTVDGVLLCVETDYASATWDITVRAKLQEPCLLLKSGMPLTIALPKGVE